MGALGRGIQTGQQSCGGALCVEVGNRQRAPDPEAWRGKTSTPAGIASTRAVLLAGVTDWRNLNRAGRL